MITLLEKLNGALVSSPGKNAETISRHKPGFLLDIRGPLRLRHVIVVVGNGHGSHDPWAVSVESGMRITGSLVNRVD